MNILLVSTSVGPLGSGLGGGVELTLKNVALALQQRGQGVRVLAPLGSQLSDIPLTAITGAWQTPMQGEGRRGPVSFAADGVLVALWEQARQWQDQYDLILNFAYDWLPFYLTPFFTTPLAHLVSMGSLTDAMDRVIGQVYERSPQAIAFHSRAQAATFGLTGARCLGNALDLREYEFQPQPQNRVAWVGRIAPEKALEDAIAACEQKNLPLHIYGKLQDPEYWQALQNQFPQAHCTYCGFLSTSDLQRQLGLSRALLVTPRWLEAFGNVAMEALACGVPVIAYRRGGPAEIVQDGITGFLVEPDSVAGLAAALTRIDTIDRQACRRQAEAEYSLSAFGDRLWDWFTDLLS